MSTRPTDRLTLIALALGHLFIAPDEAACEDVADFFNVVASRGADPSIVRHQGRYYAALSAGGDVALIRSRYLSTLGAGERKLIWSPPAGSPVAKNLWAPELVRLRGAWYLYVAADDGRNANHRMYVLENKAADPFTGRFDLRGRVFDPDHDRWAIDGTVLETGDRLYFLWSGWEGTEDVRQCLYIAPMSNPWTLAGPRVEISRPEYPWETRGAPPAVNEGPQVLLRGRRVHLIYSASGSWTDSYCLGRLTASLDGDLLAPASWKKHDEPVFSTSPGVFGPGHCTFVTSPDGREDWIVYHAARYRGAGWNRLLRAQPFSWDAEGFPRLGAPVPPDRPIPLPGGEPPRLRLEAESAERAGDVRVVSQPGASGAAKVVVGARDDSTLSFMVETRRAGTYVLSIRYLNPAERRTTATQTLTVDDGPPEIVRYAETGPADWSNTFVTVALNAGLNRVRLAGQERAVAIDCLDVVPGESPPAEAPRDSSRGEALELDRGI